MNEWILICNSKYFNLKKAFETEATVTWPLEDKMLVGDVAYFYVTNPYRTILYKCEVTDTNLYHMDDVAKTCVIHALFYENTQVYMRLKLLKTYTEDLLTDQFIKENGLPNIQSNCLISSQLSKAIKRKEQTIVKEKKILLKWIAVTALVTICLVLVIMMFGRKDDLNNIKIEPDKSDEKTNKDTKTTQDTDNSERPDRFIYVASDIVLVGHKIDLQYVENNLYRTGIKWTSSNNSVATVDDNGVLTALSSGITKISVDGIGIERQIMVVESPNNPKVNIQFDYDSISLHSGEENSVHITFDGNLPEHYGAIIYPLSGLDLSFQFDNDVVNNQVDVNIRQGFESTVDSGEVYILLYPEEDETNIIGVGKLRIKNGK